MNTSSLNPLDIPSILETVFGSLTVFNLKKCRLVSSLWASEATPLLLHRSKISFKTIPELTSVLSDFSPDTLSALCTSFDISSELNLSSDGVLEFFAKFGPIIKSLDLSFHTDYGDSWASRVFPGLTSLQELCLNGASSWLREESFGTQPCDGMTLKFLFIYDSSMDDDNIGPWLENVYQLLCTQKNLERLFFAPFLETRAHSFFNVFSSEGLFHSRISHLHINHLSATPLQLRALISRNLPLKYVHLVLTPTLGRQDVEEFLVKTCATLRELTLTFTEGATTSQFHPLPLDHLSKLSLIGYAGPLITGTARNLQLFVMSLPDNQVDNHVDNHVLNLNQECRDLEIYDSKGKYDPVTVQLVVGHFTGLKSLKMNNIDNTLLRQVYLNCPGLTELSICYHKFYGVSPLPIDGGLCGIPEFRLGEELLQVFGEEELRGLRCYPWIGGMKCLTLLALELGHVTDFGVVLGIARSESIRKLVLKRCDPVFGDNLTGEMTDLGLESICGMKNLTYLKLQGYNAQFSEGVLETCRKRREGIETYFL